MGLYGAGNGKEGVMCFVTLMCCRARSRRGSAGFAGQLCCSVCSVEHC